MHRVSFNSAYAGNQSRSKIVELDNRGSGGALFIVNAHLGIYGCTFIDNSANVKSLLSKDGYAKILNSKFVISSAVYRTNDDAVLTSQGTLLVQGIEIIVTDKNPSRSRIFSHVSSGKFTTVKVTDIKITCPVYSQLKTETLSTSVRESLKLMKRTSIRIPEYLEYNDVKYICSPCHEGYYMLEYGFYGIEKWTQNMTINPAEGTCETLDGSHIITDPEFQCHQCPWGGVCNGSITAKPNYWGLIDGNRIYFFRCPNSYYCSKEPCNNTNECASHRSGTLCGRCEDGFSKAIFSVECIENSTCEDSWVIPFSFLLATLYGTFLLFQKDIRDFLLGKPIGKSTLLQHINLTKRDNIKTSAKDNDNGNQKEEGGIFLIWLFYYFQDASIIHFSPIYAKPNSPLVHNAKQVVGGLFEIPFRCPTSSPQCMRISRRYSCTKNHS